MRALYILAAVLILLFLIGQIRVGGQAEYSAQGFVARIRIGAWKFQVFPGKNPKQDRPKKKKAKKPKKGKKASAKGQEGAKPEDKPPEKKPVTEKIGGALDYAQALLPTALEAAGRFKRKLQVDTLYLELTVGSPDPGDTALRYGQASAALGALWYPLTQAFRVKDGTAHVTVDFDAQEMTLYGLASLSLKIGQILWLGLYFGIKALRGFLKVRKEQKIKQKRKAA